MDWLVLVVVVYKELYLNLKVCGFGGVSGLM